MILDTAEKMYRYFLSEIRKERTIVISPIEWTTFVNPVVVDWAKTKLKDYYVLPKFEHIESKSNHKTMITQIKPIENIIPMSQVIEKVSAISDSIYMNLNFGSLHNKRLKMQDLRTKSKDEILELKQQQKKRRLVLEFRGNFDLINNRCLRGRVYLDTGEMEVNKNEAIRT